MTVTVYEFGNSARVVCGERITTVISARMDGTTCEHITIETRSIGT